MKEFYLKDPKEDYGTITVLFDKDEKCFYLHYVSFSKEQCLCMPVSQAVQFKNLVIKTLVK